MFPVPGLSDNEEIGIRRGRLHSTGDQMVDLFMPVLEEVYNLVKGQVRNVRKSRQSFWSGVLTEPVSSQIFAWKIFT